MKYFTAIIPAAILSILIISGCAGLVPYKNKLFPPEIYFDGTFKGPITYTKGPEAWGKTMKITLYQQDKQGKGTWALHGEATAMYDNNPWQFFKITGQVDREVQTRALLSFLDIDRDMIFNAVANWDTAKGELEIIFNVKLPPFYPSQAVKATLRKI